MLHNLLRHISGSRPLQPDLSTSSTKLQLPSSKRPSATLQHSENSGQHPPQFRALLLKERLDSILSTAAAHPSRAIPAVSAAAISKRTES